MTVLVSVSSILNKNVAFYDSLTSLYAFITNLGTYTQSDELLLWTSTEIESSRTSASVIELPNYNSTKQWVQTRLSVEIIAGSANIKGDRVAFVYGTSSTFRDTTGTPLCFYQPANGINIPASQSRRVVVQINEGLNNSVSVISV